MDESSGAVIAGIVVTVLVSLGVYVFSSIALGKIFVKLGEQAWKGWVPIVNTITLFELGRYSALWVVGLFIPAANLVALVVFIMAVNNVNRRLGHGGGFTLLYLVSFPIWAGVVGFGKSVDTGWMPGLAATGYVPFAPVTPLSMNSVAAAPAPLAAPVSAGQSVMPPAPPAPPAAFLAKVPPTPPAPPAPPVPSAPPAPSAPLAPAANGLPTGPPPFYVSAPPAPPVFSAPPAPPAPPVLAAPPAVPAPPAPTVFATPPAPPVFAAPPVVAAPSAPPAPPAPPFEAASPAPAAEPANPWAPPAPVIQTSAAPAPASAPVPPAEASAAVGAAGAASVAAVPVAAVPVAAAAAVIAAVVPVDVPVPTPAVTPVTPAAGAASATVEAESGADLDAGDAEDDDLDETMIVVRRMKPWTLETEHGLKVSLTKPVVLLGRNPARGGAHPDAQLVPLHDPGKTVSKTHARLDFVEGVWGISDLQSTNGVVLIDGGGIENELDAGASAALTDRFLLGELAARIYLEA